MNTSLAQQALTFNQLDINHRDGVRALSGISTAVHRGEFVVLAGMSGSGKTSLLRAIQGHLKVAAGSLERHGTVATIYQDLRLVKQASSLNNVLHGCLKRHRSWQLLMGFPVAEYTNANQLLERVGLAHKTGCKVKQLSGGEKQRVAIARALMQQPAILLADEPIASLDRQNAREILGLLKTLAHEKNLAVLCVLHDQDLAEQYADRILTLHNGQLVEERAPQSVPEKRGKLALVTEEKTACAPQQLCHSTCSIENCLHAPTQEHVLKRSRAIAILGWTLFAGITIWSLNHLALFEQQSMGATVSALFNFVSGLFPTSLTELERIPWTTLLISLGETVQMAFVATVFAAIFSMPLAALAASNLKLAGIQRVIRFTLNAIRTVPSLLWALLFVAAVGLGPGAGVAALTAYSVGYLAKFFYEAFENIDPLAPGALKDLGASALQRFRFAIWPAAQPALIASILFMFEYNVRAASILGIVDAGGIGFYLKQYIDFRFFPAVTAGLLLILVVVVILDTVSNRLRKFLTAE